MNKDLARREFLLGASALASGALLAACATNDGRTPLLVRPNVERFDLLSAGKGSAFLPYAQGLASTLTTRGVNASAVETGGSIENIRKLDATHNANAPQLATVFLGTAHEAVTAGAAWTQGKRFANIRALFPMYETSFQCIALRSSGIGSIVALNGKRVGIGPQGGSAESYFKGLVELANLSVTIANGGKARQCRFQRSNKSLTRTMRACLGSTLCSSMRCSNVFLRSRARRFLRTRIAVKRCRYKAWLHGIL
jgi:uncharacterized protein